MHKSPSHQIFFIHRPYLCHIMSHPHPTSAGVDSEVGGEFFGGVLAAVSVHGDMFGVRLHASVGFRVQDTDFVLGTV